jgi:hypothetical protein
MVDNCRNELVGGAYVQSEAELLAVPTEQALAGNELMNDVLSFLVDGRASKGLQATAIDAPASARR